jgi:hypothetical protein
MGREAACELLATKEVLPEATRAIYSHCAIIEAPKDLPDGDYEVEFSGEVAITSLRSGAWVVGRILPHTWSEAKSFYAEQSARNNVRTEPRPPRRSPRRPAPPPTE